MSVTNLFETTLMSTKHRGLEPLDEDDDEGDLVTSILTEFSQSMTEDELEYADIDVLENYFEDWAMETGELSEDDIVALKRILMNVAEEAFSGEPENTAENIRSVLKVLQSSGEKTKPSKGSTLDTLSKRPEISTTTANVLGPTPKGVRAFLDQLKVLKHSNYAGNAASFQAKDVKVFDRVKNRYGHPYTDFNSQKPTQTALANPRLNVATEAFAAVDAVGMNMNHQHRVVNLLTGEYVTGYCNREDAERITSDLNSQFQLAMIAEGLPEQPVVMSKVLPSTPLQEGLFDNSNVAKYAAYLNKSTPSKTMDGGMYQSTNVDITAMADFKATAALQSRASNKFVGETETTEQNALRSRQMKSNPRPSFSTMELLTNDASTDREFLAGINKNSLLQG
jgi:hypothetical protein